MQNMQHLPAVDEMVCMIRDKSIHLTAHFDPVVPWLDRALNLWTRDEKTAFVQSFLGQVSDTGLGSICKPYHFLRGNFMDCVVDAAKKHSGDGTAMMCAIIKMMDTRLKPGNYRVTETIDRATGAIKKEHFDSVQAGFEIFAGVINRLVARGELGSDSVRFGYNTQSTTDAGSVLAALLAQGNGSKQGGGGSKPGLSASTFGGLGVSARKIFESLPGDSAGIDAVMKFLQENPSATVRVKLGSNQCLVGVGTVEGEQVKLFKQPRMIKYYNRSNPEMFGIATQEWYTLNMISRLLCNGKLNYVFTPVGAYHARDVPHIMLTEYLVDSKQHALGPVISALNKMTMSTEAVVDPVIGFGVQTGTDPLKAGEPRKWFAAHDVPSIEITLNGVTRTYTVLAPQSSLSCLMSMKRSLFF